MRWIAIAALAMGIVGCYEDRPRACHEIVEVVDVGSVLTADEIPTSRGDTRTRIDCSGGTFIVHGVRSVLKGKAVQVRRWCDGDRYLFVDGEDRGWKVY